MGMMGTIPRSSARTVNRCTLFPANIANTVVPTCLLTVPKSHDHEKASRQPQLESSMQTAGLYVSNMRRGKDKLKTATEGPGDAAARYRAVAWSAYQTGKGH